MIIFHNIVELKRSLKKKGELPRLELNSIINEYENIYVDLQ